MSDKKAFALPAIHINNMEAQAEQYRTAYEAAAKALDALLRTGNGREFYLSDEAWEQAKKEENEAYRNLRAIREYTKAWADWANGDILANQQLATNRAKVHRHALDKLTPIERFVLGVVDC
jgi:hypothetical protein